MERVLIKSNECWSTTCRMLPTYDTWWTQFLGTSVFMFVKWKKKKKKEQITSSAYFTGLLKYGSDEITIKYIMDKL